MMNDLVKLIPQQWVGIVAVLLIGLYAVTQLAAAHDAVAKVIPFGRMYREYRTKQQQAMDPARLKTLFEEARKSMMDEENVVLTALERRVASIAGTSEQQAKDIRELQYTVRAFTAWSIYDARWHHRVQLLIADGNLLVLTALKHYDFFEFEKIHRTDPYQAAQLSQDLGLSDSKG